MKALQNRLYDFGLELFRPQERTTVTEWAEGNAYLSERTTEMAGSYRTVNYPYVREILENFADPKVKRVGLCWGSQTGKTTTILCGLGWAVDQAPAPVLWVWSNEKQAKSFHSDRLMPFCEDTKAIAQHLPRTSDGMVDRDRAASMHIQFDTCTLNMVGGQSQRNVRNYPVSYLLMDEIDVIPDGIRRDAMDRVKGRRNYKVIQSSTPIEQETGIWSEYLLGDQRKWFMPCPHCNKEIDFQFKAGKGKYNLKFDPKAKGKDGSYDLYKVKQTTFYQCQKCKGKITDADKLQMVRNGRWKPTVKTGEPNVRTYHLSSLYSPTVPFHEMMIRWLQANASVDGLRQFVTGWLAEPWHDEILNITEEATSLLARDYDRGEMKGDYRLMGIDVQRSHFWWIVRGYDMDGTSYLIDHGAAASWEDLDTYFKNYDCAAAIVDSGYGERTQEVYENVWKRRRTFWACKGWARLASGPYKIQSLEPFSGKQKKHGKQRIRYLHVDTDVWGGELLKRRGKKVEGFALYKNPDKEYLKQFNAKYLIEKVDNKGNVKVEWRTKGHKQDHYWDCELYVLCLSKVLGLGNITRNKEGDAPPAKPPRKKEGGSFWT
jgi:phage terminase large subunit GpA-like protein